MLARSFLIAVCLAFITSSSEIVLAQERNLPEEVRALAVLCSSGASVKFQGRIEGGIIRLFGKVLEGEGELEKSKSEADFLGSFDDEQLRLEARSIYNECVLDALQIIYNRKQNETLGSSDSQLLVPDSLTRVQAGTQFALRVGDTIGLEDGGVISLIGQGRKDKCGKPRVHISNDGRAKIKYFRTPGNLEVPNRAACWITLYGERSLGEDDACLYSFLYQCR